MILLYQTFITFSTLIIIQSLYKTPKQKEREYALKQVDKLSVNK